ERGCPSHKLFLRHKLGDRRANFAKQKSILVECSTDEPLKVRGQQKEGANTWKRLFLNDAKVQARLLLQVSAAFVLTRSAACYTRIEPLSRSVVGRPESEFGASRFAPSSTPMFNR